MDSQKKQRLVGVMVLISLAIIFLPSLFYRDQDNQRVAIDTTSFIPPKPIVEPVVITPPKSIENIKPAPAPDKAFQPQEVDPAKLDNPSEDKLSLNDKGLPDGWVVQLGSFKSQKGAEDLTAKLLKQNYKAYLRPVTVNEIEYFRVFVGPYIDRVKASAVKVEVDKQYKLKSKILLFTAE